MAENSSNDSIEMETVDHLHVPVSPARTDIERNVDTYTHLESFRFHPETNNLLLLTSALTGDYSGGKIFLLESAHALPTAELMLSSPVDLKGFIGTHAQRTAAGNTDGCWISSKEFAVSSERGTVEVFQKAYSAPITSGSWKGIAYEAISVMYAHDNIVSSVQNWSADPDTLVTSSYDCCCHLWSLKSYSSTQCYRAHMGPIHCLACQPDGVNLFVTGACERNELMRVWDRREKMSVGRVPGLLPFLSVRSLAWDIRSPNSIAIGTETGHLVLHDMRSLSSESHLCTSQPHSDVIRQLSFCPQQESLLATASHDNTAKIFSTKTEALVTVPAQHSDMLTSLDWYPQSSLLFTGSLNCEILATQI